MKSIHDVRRENLINLINQEFNGVQTRLAERIGTQANLVNRWARGAKIIGDQSARKIETAARKPVNWMDIDREKESMPYRSPETGSDAAGSVVAYNLESWMNDNRDLSSQGKLARACGASQATIGRVLKNEVSVSITLLEQIASAFGRHGYELMIHPGDPSLIKYDRQKYAQLPEEEKKRIENFINFAISQNELKQIK